MHKILVKVIPLISLSGVVEVRAFSTTMDSLPTSFGRGGGGGGGRRRDFSLDARNQNNRRGGGRGGRGRGGGRGGYGRGGGRGGRGGRGRGGRFGRGGMPPRQHDIGRDFVEVIEAGDKTSGKSLSIAIEGCCHGELNNIYRRLEVHEQQTGKKVDLLLCCGDFQSLRNVADYHSSSIPPKYRRLGSFPQYYSGERRAPILTLFIGGNHEASQPLRELHYGGWVAPNIYYLGAAGVVRFGGIRIGGMSGIYSKFDYELGQFERPPLERGALKSIYHVRNVDVYRLKCLSQSKNRLDLMMSHDWPLGIEQHGDTNGLIKRKPFFRKEIQENDLGSPPNREVMDTVKPKWWFSAHLHVKFRASLNHSEKEEESTKSKSDDTPTETPPSSLIPSQVSQTGKTAATPDDKTSPPTDNNLNPEATENSTAFGEKEQGKSNEDNGISSATEFIALESNSTNKCGGPDLTDQMTQFLALDKCLPRRQYLSILNVPTDIPRQEAVLEYDPDWLAILRKTHDLTNTERQNVTVPDELIELTDADIEWVENRIKEQSPSSDLSIPENFSATVPEQSHPMFQGHPPPMPIMGNPQTDALLKVLELDHILTVPYSPEQTRRLLNPDWYRQPPPVEFQDQRNHPLPAEDENEIDLELDDDDEGEAPGVGAVADEDENEIDIDEDDEEESSAPSKKPKLDE